MEKSNFRRDQAGVVWFGFLNPDGPIGMVSRAGYEAMLKQGRLEGPAYEDLELWDSHEQNMVDVD